MPDTMPLDKITAVALDARNSLDFLEKVFALYAAGETVVICRSDIDLEDYPALEISRHIRIEDRFGWSQMPYHAAVSDPAQIVFSSGTEGKPKAIVIGPTALTDVEDRLLEAMEVTAEIREYIGVPVTYSFGLGRARLVARAGGAFYLPERFDPIEIRTLLQAGEINAISAVPSMWRVLLARPDFFGESADTVRWIEIGSQYMSGDEKAALRQMFPKARIVQHYGLTEASRSTFLTIDGAPEATLDSVGHHIGQTEIKIGGAGEICIRGPHLASGLLEPNGAMRPLTDADGWLHTKDRGEIRDGVLWYSGRIDDQINLSGVKLAAEVLERELAELITLEQSHFAITSVPDLMRGETVLLAYNAQAASHAALLQAGLAQVLSARGVEAGAAIRMLPLEALPQTGSGKVQRKALRALWSEGAQPPASGNAQAEILRPEEEEIAAVWRSVLGPVPLSSADTFYDVGGDSLGAMQIGLAMEQTFSRDVVRATLEGRALGDIADLSSSQGSNQHESNAALPAQTTNSWALNMTRGFMVISVILSHWMPGVWARVAPDLGYDPIAFLSRMGTPGFAVVFGMGIGYFMLGGYPGNKDAIRRRVRATFSLVFAAVLLTAVVALALQWSRGIPITGRNIGEAFYGVLGYYALAILAIPLTLRLLQGRLITVALLGIPLLWLCWLAAGQIIGHTQLETPLEWVRLMLVAKYSIFHMTPMVLAGVLIGHWMRQIPDPRRFGVTALWVGGSLCAIALIAISEVYGLHVLFKRNAPFWSDILGGALYAGFACFFLGAMILLLQGWGQMRGAVRFCAKFLILLGGLALPIYAFHGLVIPVKDLLVVGGLPGKLSLLLTLALFFGAIGYGMWRLNRMYFR